MCIRDSSWFSAVPTQFSYILNNEEIPEDISSLRFARSASAPLSPDIHKKFEKRFGIPIIETMGLTETGSQITTNPMPPGQRKIGSPGKAYGNQIMISDDQFEALPAVKREKYWLRAIMSCRGILNNPKKPTKQF